MPFFKWRPEEVLWLSISQILHPGFLYFISLILCCILFILIRIFTFNPANSIILSFDTVIYFLCINYWVSQFWCSQRKAFINFILFFSLTNSSPNSFNFSFIFIYFFLVYFYIILYFYIFLLIFVFCFTNLFDLCFILYVYL